MRRTTRPDEFTYDEAIDPESDLEGIRIMNGSDAE
jgi:hypothetical protein